MSGSARGGSRSTRQTAALVRFGTLLWRRGSSLLGNRRWVLTAVSAFWWVSWAGVAWPVMAYDLGPPLRMVSEVLRHVALVVTVAALLSWVVGPVLSTALAWREIGRSEARCKCQCHKNLGTVVSINRVRASRDV